VSDETAGPAPGELFAFDQRIAELKLPVTGDSLDSAKFPFSVRAVSLQAVQARLGIRIYHKLNLIDHVQLNIRFAESAAQGPGIEVVFQHVDPERGIEGPDPSAVARALTISISR